jgi:hypothetical protein
VLVTLVFVPIRRWFFQSYRPVHWPAMEPRTRPDVEPLITTIAPGQPA